MGTIQAKTKIGGIEEIYGSEIFFGLLGWTDKGFESHRIRFNISAQQNNALESISAGIHAGSITNVARAALGLGVLVETYQKGRHIDIVDGIIRDIKINHSMGENAERIADKLILNFNFSSDKMLDELKGIIERCGNNRLGRYIWSRVQSSYPFNCKINYHPMVKDISGFIANINWGCVELDDNKRFKLWRSPENEQIEFKCTKRITVMTKDVNREFYHFSKAKFARGVFVKGLYILAKWFRCNDKTMLEWYSIARLIERLHLLDAKAY